MKRLPDSISPATIEGDTSGNTSETTIASPFSIRSQYMTKTFTFVDDGTERA